MPETPTTLDHMTLGLLGVSRRSYESRQCRRCERDYLFPAYGGRQVCNDCMWTSRRPIPTKHSERHFQ